MYTLRSSVLCMLIGALAPLFTTTSTAQPKGRAFEISDYYRTAFVGAPEVDKAGSKVVFPVRRYDLEKGESWSEIWMMEADGSGLRQMTTGRHNDTSPVFSPDSTELCYVSNHDPDPASSTNADLWVVSITENSGSDAAADLTQEVFIKVYTSLGRLQEPGDGRLRIGSLPDSTLRSNASIRPISDGSEQLRQLGR